MGCYIGGRLRIAETMAAIVYDALANVITPLIPAIALVRLMVPVKENSMTMNITMIRPAAKSMRDIARPLRYMALNLLLAHMRLLSCPKRQVNSALEVYKGLLVSLYQSIETIKPYPFRDRVLMSSKTSASKRTIKART